MPEEIADLSRRALLQAASLGVLNLDALAGAQEKVRGEEPLAEDRNRNRSLPRRLLGRTNMRVTTIGSGGAGITGPEILFRAIDTLINSETVFSEDSQNACLAAACLKLP